MATRTQKKLQRKKKRRERKHHNKRNPLTARHRLSVSSTLRSDALRPKQPQREKTPIDFWWEDYLAGDGATRLQMAREKLETIAPDDEQFLAFFPDAIGELQTKMSLEEYVAILEEIEVQHPDVFAMSADWNTKFMAYVYVADGRLEELDRRVKRFVDGMTEIGDPFFSLVSFLRLAGREAAVQNLIDAASELVQDTQLMYWAVNEIVEWALFAPFQQCVQSGIDEAGLARVNECAKKLGADDTTMHRDRRRNVALHLAGEGVRSWTRGELLQKDQDTQVKMYLLVVDFSRWLVKRRRFPAVVADELRCILMAVIEQMDAATNDFLRGLTRADIEPFLVQRLGILSLDDFRAPAAIIAMKHFYDFLEETQLVDESTRRSAHSVCDALWKDLKHAMRKRWPYCRFLEAYLPTS